MCIGGTPGVGGILASGDLMSTLTGGACERLAPQLKQNRASSVFGFPQTWHVRIYMNPVILCNDRFLNSYSRGVESGHVYLPSDQFGHGF